VHPNGVLNFNRRNGTMAQNFGCIFLSKVLKGIGSQDGLELSLHALVHLGLKKGCGRFSEFFLMFLFQKKYRFIFFLEVNRKPTSLDYVTGVYLVIIISLLVSAAGN
jgi:hypothetical protein